MRRHRIDSRPRRHRARPCSAARRRAWRVWLIGIEQREQLGRLVALAERGKGDDRPDGGMGVLAAILANARRIALDVAGIERRLVERRREQQRQPVVAAGRAARSSAAIACAARAGSPAPEIRPRTARWNRSGIRRCSPSRAACRRRNSRGDTSRRPSPRARARPRSAAACARPGRGARGLARAPSRDRREGRERRMQEPAEPDAFALPSSPTRFMPSFQSPVPISGRPCAPDQRGSRSSARAQCSNSDAVSSATLGWKKRSCSPGAQRRALEEGHASRRGSPHRRWSAT